MSSLTGVGGSAASLYQYLIQELQSQSQTLTTLSVSVSLGSTTAVVDQILFSGAASSDADGTSVSAASGGDASSSSQQFAAQLEQFLAGLLQSLPQAATDGGDEASAAIGATDAAASDGSGALSTLVASLRQSAATLADTLSASGDDATDTASGLSPADAARQQFLTSVGQAAGSYYDGTASGSDETAGDGSAKDRFVSQVDALSQDFADTVHQSVLAAKFQTFLSRAYASA